MNENKNTWICSECTFENNGNDTFCKMCEVDNHFAIADMVQVYDKIAKEWHWGNVCERDGFLIKIHFIGLQNDYDETLHVIKDKARLRKSDWNEPENETQNKRKRKLSADDADDSDDGGRRRKKQKLNGNDGGGGNVKLIQLNENLKDAIFSLNTKVKGMKGNMDKIELLDEKELNELEMNLKQKRKIIIRRKVFLQKIDNDEDIDLMGGNYGNNVNNERMDEDEDEDIDLVKNNELLKEQIKGLEKQIKSRNDEDVIDMLNMDELRILHMQIKEKLIEIREAKVRLMEDKLLCIVCMENPKNVFIQDCNHFDLCYDCVDKLTKKECPRCQEPFENISIL